MWMNKDLQCFTYEKVNSGSVLIGLYQSTQGNVMVVIVEELYLKYLSLRTLSLALPLWGTL